MRRAAPEIYLGILAEGARTVREWTETNFAHTKGSEAWIELWDRASLVDHLCATASTDQELMALLGSNDSLEVNLRRLASQKYKGRTGDRAGAAQMLAIHAPGGSTDVAPVQAPGPAAVQQGQGKPK